MVFIGRFLFAETTRFGGFLYPAFSTFVSGCFVVDRPRSKETGLIRQHPITATQDGHLGHGTTLTTNVHYAKKTHG